MKLRLNQTAARFDRLAEPAERRRQAKPDGAHAEAADPRQRLHGLIRARPQKLVTERRARLARTDTCPLSGSSHRHRKTRYTYTVSTVATPDRGWLGGNRVHLHLNPHMSTDLNSLTFAAADPNVHPKRDVPLWSETRWNGCWNPEQGVGLYLHAGRFRRDLDFWWAQAVAYLPDGRVVVDRTFGRNLNPAGVTVGSLAWTVTDGGWESEFDGISEATTIAALAHAPRGSGAPSARVQWQVSAESISPAWDPFAGIANLDFAGDAHVQQASRTTGVLTVDGVQYSLAGVGFKDHSSGVRSFDTWQSHGFVLAHLPHGVLHAFTIRRPDGGATTLGAMFRDGEQVGSIEAFELPVLHDKIGAREQMIADVTVAGQDPIRIEAELIHALPMTISEDNDNINGVDWELPGDPVVLIEGIGRYTVPGQGVGYGMLERSARRSQVIRPD